MILSAFLWMLSSWLRVVDEALVQYKQASYIPLCCELKPRYTVCSASDVKLKLLANFLRAPSFCPALEAMDDMCSDHDNLLSMITPRISSSSWTASGSHYIAKYRFVEDGVRFLDTIMDLPLCCLMWLSICQPKTSSCQGLIEAGCYPVAVLEVKV